MSETHFTEDQFHSWYDAHEKKLLEPARETFVRLLADALTLEFGDPTDGGRNRAVVSNARIKHWYRAWEKLNRTQYKGRANAPESVPEVIDDLVAVRIVCNSIGDIERVKEGVLKNLTAKSLTVLWDTAKDYINERVAGDPTRPGPKPSGYRAFHVNLKSQVPCLDKMAEVEGELQVRTLPQDAWGELTHEETYRPDDEIEQLPKNLAIRMALLLSAIDDMAEDVRGLLDPQGDESAMLAEKPAQPRSTDAVGVDRC